MHDCLHYLGATQVDQKQGKMDRKALVNQNTQLLRELQVAAQDNKNLARTLDSTQVLYISDFYSTRDCDTRNRA